MNALGSFRTLAVRIDDVCLDVFTSVRPFVFQMLPTSMLHKSRNSFFINRCCTHFFTQAGLKPVVLYYPAALLLYSVPFALVRPIFKTVFSLSLFSESENTLHALMLWSCFAGYDSKLVAFKPQWLQIRCITLVVLAGFASGHRFFPWLLALLFVLYIDFSSCPQPKHNRPMP